MFSATHLAFQAEQHRLQMLAEAEHFRLARIARAGRRRARVAATTDRRHDDEGNRRYTVPR